MTSVLLIYPYFRSSLDRSRFRFPPLGIAYVAAAVRAAGHDVQILDCTFLRRDEAVRKALAAHAKVVGISCLATMMEDSIRFAELLRGRCSLLVAGGPLPTCEPAAFLSLFDVVVRGEGERTMCEILAAHETGDDLCSLPGVTCRRDVVSPTGNAGSVHDAAPRPFASDLDRIAFPARDLLPNQDYIRFGKQKYGFSITTVMSTRGCPFQCEFCSNVVFGNSYRQRSASSVIDEVEEALALGYERISFADDVFTLNARRVVDICAEIHNRGLQFAWECLGRVDTFDDALAQTMKRAGCFRIFFGIESGNDQILKLMNKQITVRQAQAAVDAAHRAGLEVGAFFILAYPGESDDTVLETLHFATLLPLDYLGLTMPYPLPGTALFARVGDRVKRVWRPDDSPFLNQVLIFDADVSVFKMRFGILKGRAQFTIKKRLGRMAPLVLGSFEKATDRVYRLLR
jgi:anaerobic magnesium-protoporphyrin IX monomethyl ester cyclase